MNSQTMTPIATDWYLVKVEAEAGNIERLLMRCCGCMAPRYLTEKIAIDQSKLSSLWPFDDSALCSRLVVS